jgi:hypothetical protein
MERIINKKAMTIAVILLVIVAVLAIMLTISYNQLIQLENNMNDELTNQTESTWDYINARISDNYDKARTQSSKIKLNIVSDIKVKYTSNEKLSEDLQNTINGEECDLTSILGRNISSVYFNNIKNDANDPFIISSKKVLTDFSVNCSAEQRTRDFNKEISMHFNHALAKDALEAIVSKSTSKVFWCYVPVDKEYPWYNDVKNIKLMDMTELRDLFYKYKDIRVLSTFEFIGTDYIYEKSDLVGEPVVNDMGMKNNKSNQLFINSNFNIVDVLMSNPNDSVVIYSYDKSVSSIQRTYEMKKTDVISFIIIEILAFLISLVALSRLQHSILSRSNK